MPLRLDVVVGKHLVAQEAIWLSATECLELKLTLVDVALGVDNAKHLVATVKLKVFYLRAQLGPCLASIGYVEHRVGYLHTLLYVLLERSSTRGGDASPTI